jgi:RNA polymerase sigma factor (sigma-70 family)
MKEHLTKPEILVLITMARSRLEKAARLAIRHNSRLQRWVHPEDIVQEVLLRMVKACEKIDITDRSHLYHLMLTQLRRVIIDSYRNLYGPNGWATKIKSDPKGIDLSQATENDLTRTKFNSGEPITIEEWVDFHESVEILPRIEQEVFEMMYYGGFTSDEVSEILQVSSRTVRRHWRDSRLILQRRINENRGESKP